MEVSIVGILGVFKFEEPHKRIFHLNHRAEDHCKFPMELVRIDQRFVLSVLSKSVN